MIPTTLRDGDSNNALRHTMRDGVVHDWDCLESLLHRTFYGRLGWEAGVDEGAVLFSEQVLTPRRDRERLTALCFERFGLAGMFVAEAPVLALYSVGRSSGLVADVGHDGASVAAVIDGAAFAAASRRVTGGGGGGGGGDGGGETSTSFPAPLGGLAAERALRARLAARLGAERAAAVPEGVLRAAKNAVCRVAASAAEARKKGALSQDSSAASTASAAAGDANAPSTSKHVLPDGTELEVTAADGIAAGEALVAPFFSSSSSSGGVGGGNGGGGGSGTSSQGGNHRQQHPSLAELLSLALSSIPDTGSRRLASEALMVCGGGSGAPGLAARVVADGGGTLPPSHPAPPPLLAVPDYVPQNMMSSAAWAGGAILARVVFQQQQHVSRAEYDEFGPTVVHRKAA